jgi:hypothetical protein
LWFWLIVAIAFILNIVFLLYWGWRYEKEEHAVALVLGFMAIFVTGIWHAFSWLLEATTGYGLTELCNYLGVFGSIILIILMVVAIFATIGVFRPCTDFF